jgi:hypothetical protein
MLTYADDSLPAFIQPSVSKWPRTATSWYIYDIYYIIYIYDIYYICYIPPSPSQSVTPPLPPFFRLLAFQPPPSCHTPRFSPAIPPDPHLPASPSSFVSDLLTSGFFFLFTLLFSAVVLRCTYSGNTKD